MHGKVPKHANLTKISENMQFSAQSKGIKICIFHVFIAFLNINFEPKNAKICKTCKKKFVLKHSIHPKNTIYRLRNP
jgi:hypothetical protein